MGVANLEYFNSDGNYSCNISVEATEERMDIADDDASDDVADKDNVL